MMDQPSPLSFSISQLKVKRPTLMEVVLDIKDGGETMFIRMISLENQMFKMFMEHIIINNSKDSLKLQRQDNIDSM